jgi:hypothetical protein
VAALSAVPAFAGISLGMARCVLDPGGINLPLPAQPDEHHSEPRPIHTGLAKCAFSPNQQETSCILLNSGATILNWSRYLRPKAGRMGNSFAHAVNVTLPEPHGQETFPSYRLSKPIIIKNNSSKNVPLWGELPMGQAPMGQAYHFDYLSSNFPRLK